MTGTGTLDCESPEKAIASLAAVMNVPLCHLEQRLSSWPWRSFCAFEKEHTIAMAREELWRRTFAEAKPPVTFECYWFHMTRVLPETDYREGLLPLGDKLAELLTLRLEEAGVMRERTPSGDYASTSAYDEKIQNATRNGGRSLGPFGSLLREIAFWPGQNLFLNYPEMIADLHFDLAAFMAKTIPCIVKFHAAAEDEEHDNAAQNALLYCYQHVWNRTWENGYDCNSPWNGCGRTVPATDIVRLDFLA